MSGLPTYDSDATDKTLNSRAKYTWDQIHTLSVRSCAVISFTMSLSLCVCVCLCVYVHSRTSTTIRSCLCLSLRPLRVEGKSLNKTTTQSPPESSPHAQRTGPLFNAASALHVVGKSEWFWVLHVAARRTIVGKIRAKLTVP